MSEASSEATVPAPSEPHVTEVMSVEEILEPVTAGRAAAPGATPAAGLGVGAGREQVTCPGCGSVGLVDLARREASDFCPSCDFPLFWTPSRVIALDGPPPEDSGLRRLPGTAGHAALASLACPSCTEPNPPTGLTCLRCGAPLHPVPVAEPEPELIPLHEPEPEPEHHWRWWPLAVAAGLAIVALVLLLVYGW